jgi:hypothetical protein
MSKYRIKIEERNNGEMYYIPQICELEVTRGWIQKQRLIWYNIINNHGDVYILSTTQEPKHTTEEGAMQVINDHGNYVNKEHGQQIKRITYKTIE